MKKGFTSLLALCLLLSMVLQPVSVSASASSNMTNVLTQYQKKNYKKAKEYNKKLSKYANEACVKKMPTKMKQAYKKVIRTYSLTGDKKGNSLWDIYYSDIDNDGKAELLLQYGSCEADLYLYVYKYKNGKAVKVAKTSAGHSCFYAYPNHNGIIRMSAHMGYESISVLTLKNGKIKTKKIGSRDNIISYFPLRQELRGYVKYDSNYNEYIDYSVLK